MANNIEKLANIIRYYSLVMPTEAGSGHPTSSLSATDIMTNLFFNGFFKYDISKPGDIHNDRLIFSKGHASPLFFSLWAAAKALPYDELLSFRTFTSRLEGHPSMHFSYTEAATGSLGQGLSIGAGMALAIKLKIQNDELDMQREPKVFVLMGDSEFAEGQIYEAMELSSHYYLNNLVGVLDVNRLGQSNETLLGWDIHAYEKRIASFGWNTIVVNGHDNKDIYDAFNSIEHSDTNKPTMIIAKTIKGKGVSFLENSDKWHGKALNEDDLKKALDEIDEIDEEYTGKLALPNYELRMTNDELNNSSEKKMLQVTSYKLNDSVSTRRAYGDGLLALAKENPAIIALDGETSNSTYSETLKQLPDRFFEMFIAEQNMVSMALGLSKYDYIPFVSTFTAFFTRAFDQIRMSQYSHANVKFIGSHGGVSIGQDGSSQMGLEDISMFGSLLDSVVLYPSDAVSTQKVLEQMSQQKGISYMRTTRMDTPVIYKKDEEFPIGGSKVVYQSTEDVVTVVAAGVTLHEAIKAYKTLKKQKIAIRIVDLYSIKPIDIKTLLRCIEETKTIITVEDHYPFGGIGSAVSTALSETNKKPIYHLAVHKMPHSGTPEELLHYEEIDADAIVKKVKEIIS